MIYRKSWHFLTGKHFDNTLFHFVFDAFKRNKELDVTYFPADDHYFDAFTALKDKGPFHAAILADNRFGVSDEIEGLSKLEIPIISRVGDPHVAKKSGAINNQDRFGISYYFGFIPSSYFYKYYPQKFKYRMIIHGLEPSLYQNLTPFANRTARIGRVLNSGVTGPAKLLGRIRDRLEQPDTHGWKHYRLRTLCNRLPYVDYTPTLRHDYVGDRYPELLSQYQAAIAATTTYPTIKYWEIPAAGCLTFMEITEQNDGRVLGYVDGETAIFIDEGNYRRKFQEYLSDLDNSKWEKIASAGRDFAVTHFSNDKAVEELVHLIREELL